MNRKENPEIEVRRKEGVGMNHPSNYKKLETNKSALKKIMKGKWSDY